MAFAFFLGVILVLSPFLLARHFIDEGGREVLAYEGEVAYRERLLGEMEELQQKLSKITNKYYGRYGEDIFLWSVDVQDAYYGATFRLQRAIAKKNHQILYFKRVCENRRK